MTKKQEYGNVDVDGEGNLVFSNPNHTYTYYWNNTTLVGYTVEGNDEYYIIKVIYGEDGEPAGFTVTASGTELLYFYTKNLQGDITGICNKYGDMCLTFDYDAYGLPSYTLTGNPIDAVIAVTFNPFYYRGYMYDINTGLYYLQSRFYNPIYGRFLNADETMILHFTQGDVHGANLYAYCGNNPVVNVDPNGYNTAVIVGFSLKYGLSFSGCVLTVKLTTFISAIAPYLLVVLASIIAGYLAYKIIQKAVIKSVQNKIPNKLKTKDGRVDLSKFKNKLPNGGGWKGPDGWKIVKDFAKHAGSIWKLFDDHGKRIATLWGDGSVRGK